MLISSSDEESDILFSLPPSGQKKKEMSQQHFLFRNPRLRRRVVAKKEEGCVLFTNARDEPRIHEWIAHHLLLQFDKIIVLDHLSDPPIDIKTPFSFPEERVSVIPLDPDTLPKIKGIKMACMQIALKKARQLGAKWMLYLDADEFLHLNTDTIRQFCDKYGANKVDSISINWLMFGSSNHILDPPPDQLIIEAYTQSNYFLDEHVKSIVRVSQATHASNPHFYHVKNPLRMKNISTGQQPPILHPRDLYAKTIFRKKIAFDRVPSFIAHYIYQSEQTYSQRKLVRTRDGTNTFRDPHFQEKEKYWLSPQDFFYRDPSIHTVYNEITNFAMQNKYAERTRTLLQSIKID
jgi:hypothetical protein